MQLEIKCDLLFAEEGMHPDSIYVDRGEKVEVYYYLPQLVDLLRESLATIDDTEGYGIDRINNLHIIIRQEDHTE